MDVPVGGAGPVTGLAAWMTVALVPTTVVVALAPPGAVGRWVLRRSRPEAFISRRRRRRPVGRGAEPVRLPQPLVKGLGALGARLRAVAGRRPDEVADRRTGTAVVVSVIVSLVISPVVAVPVGALTWAAPVVRQRSRRRAHERAIRAALPDAVDLFRLAVGSGLSVHQAVDAVARRAPTPVDATLAEVQRRVAVGARLGDALEALDALGDPVLPLAAALRGSARYGSPLGAALERVAADARVLRRRRAEEDARRLPIQLLFPLVLCVLPAFGLLAVLPLLLASLRSLQL